jgi:ATP-binding cassette subfamily A (ABC1) protein 3
LCSVWNELCSVWNELCSHFEILFSQLKGLSGDALNDEIKKYISRLELEPKENAASKTLSGGMKRKLSAGVALCGGSKVSYYVNRDHLKL